VAILTMENFDYILDKVRAAPFEVEPFRHIHIEGLFTEDHFEQIINAAEVNVSPVDSDEGLIAALHERNFKEIEFPGTTTDLASYLNWRRDSRNQKVLNQATCEGFGVAMRLQATRKGAILDDAVSFFRSDRFWTVMSEKFDLDYALVWPDMGLQKYLDGYEISPHPDVRLKALTFMININPAGDSGSISYHTRYMTFKPERAYIHDFWSREATAERCWVPWDWCETKKTQPTNNSMVMFSPSNDSLHAIKASYDHLVTQRTQFYGNLWYKTSSTKTFPDYRHLAEMAPRRETVDA
jgi:hypothetical protein